MIPELKAIDIQQDIIIQLNEENDDLHDALGILRSEIEQLQTTVAELEAENIRLKQQFVCLEMSEFYIWPKAGPLIKCDYANLV